MTTATELENPLKTPGANEAPKAANERGIPPKTPEQGKQWSVLESIGKRVDELKNMIKKTAPGVEFSRAVSQLRSLANDRSRFVRPLILKSETLNKNETLRKAATALFGKDFGQDALKFIDSVSPKELMKLERIERGVLAKFYAFKENPDHSEELIEEPLNIHTLHEGDMVRIDFGRNAKANAKIGAGDILPANVNVVKIIDTSGNIRIGRRDIVGGHVGYYDINGKYLPIFNGYRIRIPQQSEITGAEYKRLGVKSVFNADKKALEELEKQENLAFESYHTRLEANEKTDRISAKVRDLRDIAGKTGNYQEQLKKALEVGERKLAELDPKKEENKEEIELLTLAINRLKNTLKIFEGKDIKGLDIDRYKEVIGAHESGGMSYFARNDDYGKRHNIHPNKWAFGKYQFTTETLRGYGVNIGNPPEESKIQDFLKDSTLQERIMDQFVSDLLSKHILTNDAAMAEVSEGKTSIVYFLALAHNGGPGAIKNRGAAVDYMSKKSADSYARAIAERYETGEDSSFLANLGRKPRTEAWADRTTPDAFISAAYKHLGKDYVWGGGRKESDTGIDCSGLVISALKDNGVVSSTYNNNAQGFFDGTVPKNVRDVKRGDLVFLRSGDRITHVEIALGPVHNGEIPIIDASSARHNVGKVAERTQVINNRVLVGSPLFY